MLDGRIDQKVIFIYCPLVFNIFLCSWLKVELFTGIFDSFMCLTHLTLFDLIACESNCLHGYLTSLCTDLLYTSSCVTLLQCFFYQQTRLNMQVRAGGKAAAFNHTRA